MFGLILYGLDCLTMMALGLSQHDLGGAHNRDADHDFEPDREFIAIFAAERAKSGVDGPWHSGWDEAEERALREFAVVKNKRSGLSWHFETARINFGAIGFAYALANLHRTLEAMSTLAKESGITLSSADELIRCSPNLREVRDNLAHWDERVRRRERSRDLPKVESSLDAMWFGPGSLAVGTSGTGRFFSTGKDGKVKSIDVTAETLTAATAALQTDINGLAWIGHPRVWPPD